MKIHSLLSLALLLSTGASLFGAATIYEPFVFPDGDTTLTGNPGGTGLSGNWSAQSGWNEGTNLTYGSLETTGDSANINAGWRKAEIGIDTSTPGYTGLLADGGDMWFSMIMQVGATNNRSYFALTTRGIGASNGDNNGDGGTPVEQGVGIGFGLASNQTIYANVWDDAENGNWGGNNLTNAPTGDVSTTTGTGAIGTYLLVGHIQWGATSTDADRIDLYMPGADLDLTGHLVSTSTGIIADQSGIDTLGFQNLTNFNVFDEIRVGATQADVLPIPEPSAIALLGLSGLCLIIRRRR